MGSAWITLRAQAPVITEFQLPTGGSSPAGIALGTDGNLWVTETAGNKIARVSTSGKVAEFVVPTSNSQPTGIAAGPDGNLWFTEVVGNNIGRITPAGTITEYRIPTASAGPAGIAPGPDGRLWFVESDMNKVGSITTQGKITEYLIGSYALPAGIVAGPDGDLWFTEPAGNQIGRITTVGVVTEFPLVVGLPEQYPFYSEGITQGPDGKLWFTSSSSVWSITTSGVTAEYIIPTPNFVGGGIVTGPDKNVWFTDQSANKIGRITTSGVLTEYAIPTAGSVPANIAAGPDGNLWFTESAANRIGRLVPPAGGVQGPLTVSPSSLVFTTYAGGPAPPAQTLSIMSSTPVSFSASVNEAVTYGQPWLRISPSGNLITNQTVTVTVNPFDLGSHATYTGNITLTSEGFTQIIAVSFVITAPPTTGNVTVTPSSLSFSFATQTNVPVPQGIDIGIPAQGVLSVPITVLYNVISPQGGNWLAMVTGGNQVFNNGGTTTAPTGLGAVINPSELMPGTYRGEITIVPEGGATVTVPVDFAVTESPTTVSTSPASLSFVWQVGAAPPPSQTLQVIESGPAVPYSVEVNGGGFLDPVASGTGISVSINTFGLTAGTYSQTFGIDVETHPTVFIHVGGILKVTDSQSNITGIVNAASFGVGALAPGELITILGTDLGPSNPVGLALDPSGKVATSLGGVSVTVAGDSAPLTYVSATQINCVVPYEIASGPVLFGNYFPVTVMYDGRSNTYTMTANASAPGIFSQNGSGTGLGAVFDASGKPNGSDNPASTGDPIVFYVTGEGQTIPAGVTGAITVVSNSSFGPLTPQPALPLRVTIGGQQAAVTFFGEAPGIVSGVMQVNAQIPPGLSGGELPLSISIGGVSSQAGLTVSVK